MPDLPAVRPTPWEYHVLTTNNQGAPTMGTFEETLANLGKEGWEYVSVFQTAKGWTHVFKRTLIEKKQGTAAFMMG